MKIKWLILGFGAFLVWKNWGVFKGLLGDTELGQTASNIKAPAGGAQAPQGMPGFSGLPQGPLANVTPTFISLASNPPPTV